MLSKEVSPWQKKTFKVPIWKVRDWVCAGILCACSQFHVSCFLNRSLWSWMLWSETGLGWTGAAGRESERHHPIGHWISMLPQHCCCRVTGVLSFDDRDWCQTPTELVWDSLMLSFPCLFAVFLLLSFVFLDLSVKQDLGRKHGSLLSITLNVWFHFSWPDCGALGVGNYILTDLSTDSRLWATLAPAWCQICACSFTNTQTCLLKESFHSLPQCGGFSALHC